MVTDAEEGLILVNVDVLGDGEPRGNFLSRALTWNPDGLLTGARHITLGGHFAYIATPRGLVIVDLDAPLKPKHIATVKLEDVRASALQFRYLFVTDKLGMRVIDVTNAYKPALQTKYIALENAQKLYVARTYAYVAAAQQGLAIIDIEKPTHSQLYQLFTADGKLNDARDVIVGSTNASLFAYVADGKNGLKVLQLTAPDTQPRFYGFSPEPKPQLIARHKTASTALALSKGLDRDRAVDERGNQIAVFGRIGSRPFGVKEMEKLYLQPNGDVWMVTDEMTK